MIYFFSDSHIGSRALGDLTARLKHQNQVIAMLQTMAKDATEIYILGDLFDYWFEYIWPDKSKQEYKPLLSQLRQMTDAGIHIHFYIGNHDLWTFGLLQRKTGITVHKCDYEKITIPSDKGPISVVLGHGDGIVPDNFMQRIPKQYHSRIRKFIFIRHIFHNPIAQFFFRLVPSPWGNRFGYNWSCASRLKEEANPCAYKGENNEEIVLWAKEQEQKSPSPHHLYIFGHRHIELDLMLASQAHVIVLGDTFRQWTYARLDTSTGTINLLNFEEE